MANYLVTGAAGFIAARVCEMLLETGHTVLGVDNLNAAYDVRMKDFRLTLLQSYPGFTFRKLDIGDRVQVDTLISALASTDIPPFDAVINLAARAGVRKSVTDPWVYIDTNVTGTLSLLELCQKQGIKKFVLASTSSVYGADAPLPTPENADSDFPLQAYAASKKGAEALCHAYHFLHDIDVTIFRYFTVYGPAGRPDMSMFRFIRWITEGVPLLLYGDGDQSRGFTYIDDIARGTIMGLKPLGFEIINLGGHETISINKLINLLEKIIGRQARINQLPANLADMRANWANTEKAGFLLGWEPQVSLNEGIKNTVEWYLSQRAWASQINLE
ncbi:MAG: SDR family NAD(P)-dependent oxidoreductase [Chloroflexota bacterium]|nr:SDR family NAD(P)-dependent oxidoreductase [Chloroflexota bacterium]